jgi:hypothetical protein
MERDGLARKATLIEQGIPVQPMAKADVQKIRIEGASGELMRGYVEPEAYDEKGMVRWVRVGAVVAVGAGGRVPVRLVPFDTRRSPTVQVQRDADRIAIRTPQYLLTLRSPGEIHLSAGQKDLLKGQWSIDAVGDARTILWGGYYRPFEATGVEVEEETPDRTTVLLRGVIAKNQRKAPQSLEKGMRIDCELRLHVNGLTPEIRYEWRITNLTRVRTWLQRYALRLPLVADSSWKSLTPDSALISSDGATLAVTADFVSDLGTGAGLEMLRQSEGAAVALGGLHMPPDGGYYSGKAADIHRLFHHGMSRTFSGALIPGGTAAAAAEALARMDLVLPPQYYSDTGALPEQGDPVTFGEFGEAIRKSAEHLLATQWRGTLFWGEWYREWDETRDMGVQETMNGHSALAPLYHYWRTGDARFLHCARRSAAFTWDIQMFKGEEEQGRMFHTRRHLFDELGWIHPRYQRATGGLIASHVFLNAPARREIVQTIRSFHQRMFDERGVPRGWDKTANRRGAGEDGVDTSNFMEALTYCYRETGDRQFLEWALQMSRWTAERWKVAGKRKGDDWNWNLTNYVLRGLVTLYETSRDPEVRDLAIEICRTTLENDSRNIADLRNGVGGGNLHFVFYHAWISTRVAKFAPDGEKLIRMLVPIVRREVALQRHDGLFTLEHGYESGIPTRWTSYYEAKSLVAYVPVLAAHLAGKAK